MRRKVLVTLLCLAIATCVMACGNKDNSTAQTETSSIVEVTETVETEVVTTESIETTEVQESETQVIETETEEIVEATEVVAETETPQSLELTYEDFACDYNGYTNYIDFDIENPGNYGIQILYSDVPDGEYTIRAENDATVRGLKLGDSRERVLELYGDYDKQVTYRNMSLKSGDRIPEENYIYRLQDPKPTSIDGLYGLYITLDTDGNVLAIGYGWGERKYF